MEYLCKRRPKIKTKNVKNYSSILAIVNHRNWLDDSPPLKKQFVIQKATVLKGKNFGNIFNKQFDTIVYCIVDTVYTVLNGINFVVSEAAC